MTTLTIDTDDLATASQLARELGVHPSLITKWSARYTASHPRYPAFPAPLFALGPTRVWSAAAVRAWVAAAGGEV